MPRLTRRLAETISPNYWKSEDDLINNSASPMIITVPIQPKENPVDPVQFAWQFNSTTLTNAWKWGAWEIVPTVARASTMNKIPFALKQVTAPTASESDDKFVFWATTGSGTDVARIYFPKNLIPGQYLLVLTWACDTVPAAEAGYGNPTDTVTLEGGLTGINWCNNVGQKFTAIAPLVNNSLSDTCTVTVQIKWSGTPSGLGPVVKFNGSVFTVSNATCNVTLTRISCLDNVAGSYTVSPV